MLVVIQCNVVGGDSDGRLVAVVEIEVSWIDDLYSRGIVVTDISSQGESSADKGTRDIVIVNGDAVLALIDGSNGNAVVGCNGRDFGIHDSDESSLQGIWHLVSAAIGFDFGDALLCWGDSIAMRNDGDDGLGEFRKTLEISLFALHGDFVTDGSIKFAVYYDGACCVLDIGGRYAFVRADTCDNASGEYICPCAVSARNGNGDGYIEIICG